MLEEAALPRPAATCLFPLSGDWALLDASKLQDSWLPLSAHRLQWLLASLVAHRMPQTLELHSGTGWHDSSDPALRLWSHPSFSKPAERDRGNWLQLRVSGRAQSSGLPCIHRAGHCSEVNLSFFMSRTGIITIPDMQCCWRITYGKP